MDSLPIAYFDLETFSAANLRTQGPHAYSADPQSKILLWGYAIDDKPAKVWDCQNEPMPFDLTEALAEVAQKKRWHVWQNGQAFDTVFLSYRVDGGPKLPIETLIDTMLIAYAHGLPGNLQGLCEIFRLPQDKAKDKDGERLVNLFCKPTPSGKIRNAQTHPEDWKKFINYCRLDIESMREVYKRLPKENCTEYERCLQVLDARINRRGICIDLPLVRGAIETSERHKELLAEKTREMTNGGIQAATQRDAYLRWINKHYNLGMESFTKAEINKHLDDPKLPEEAKEHLRNRVKSAKNSASKFKKIQSIIVGDRIKGTMQFRGASRTGRYAGRYFQPQNLARPTLSNDEIELAIWSLKNDCLVDIWADPGETLSNCVRGAIIAPAGKRLCIADYSNVEGRVLAWLAGETWKLNAFAEYDTLLTTSGEWKLPYRDGWDHDWALDKGEFVHKGHDLYKLTYSRTFNVKPESVTKAQRQMGKVLELAMGYQGGPKAFLTFVGNFHIDVKDMVKAIKSAIDPNIWYQNEGKLQWALEKGLVEDMEPETWVAFSAVADAWRRANPRITKLWTDLADACVDAIKSPGQLVLVGKTKLSAKRIGNYLYVRLPSGRKLVYPCPELPRKERCSFIYRTMEKNKFVRTKAYGGRLVENAVQAAACDLLLEAGPRLEAAGYEIVMSVHDEYICEIPDDKTRNHRHMEELMSALPSWAGGLPLVAAGFESYRYRKD